MTELNNILITIPLKNLNFTKTRLNKLLSLNERKKLTTFLLLQLINKIENLKKDINKIIDIALITSNDIVTSFLTENKILIISDNGSKSLSESLGIAKKFAIEKQYKALCFFPSDLENPNEKDLRKFIFPDINFNELRICPSNNFGTNALLISPIIDFEFKFGKNSFHKHIEIARKLKLETTILKLDSLSFDIDQPEDFEKAWFSMKTIINSNFPELIMEN